MTPGDMAPGWPTLIAAKAAAWLSGRLLNIGERSRRRPRLGLALVWGSERCARLGRRMLTR